MTTTAFAGRLGLGTSSVSGMVAKLVERVCDKSVSLTRRGRNVALDVIRRYRLVDPFLVTALLRYLAEHRIRLHGWVEVVERKPFGGPLVARIGTPPADGPHSLGSELVDAILVQVDA